MAVVVAVADSSSRSDKLHPQVTTPSSKPLHPAFAPLLLLLSLAPHLPALGAGFSFDDEEFVQQNASIQSLRAWADSALGPFPPGDPERGLFRPLTALSYVLDHNLMGGDPAAFHAANLAWYLLVILLVYRCYLAYLRDPRWALGAALIFSLHPVHCEVVDSVSGRSELLALAFTLGALLLHLKGMGLGGAGPLLARRRLLWLAAGALCYALATLSKETGFMLPGALLLQALLVDTAREAEPRAEMPADPGCQGWRGRLRGRLLTLIPFLVVSLLYLPLRWYSLGGRVRPAPHNLVSPSLWLRFHLMGKTYLEYLRLMLFPGILQVDHYYQSELAREPGPSALSWAGLIALALTLALGTSLAVRGQRARRRLELEAKDLALAALGMGLFFCYLAPVSNLIPTGAVMAERFLFSPSLGFLLMVAALVRSRSKMAQGGAGRRVWMVALALLLALFAARTALRAAEWKDEVTLWTSLERYISDDPRIHVNLAVGLARRGDLDRAERILGRVLKVQPGNLEASLNLAGIHQARGDLGKAARVLHATLRLHPNYALLHSNLGVVLARMGRLAAARRSFAKALQLNPNLAPAQGHLSNVKGQMGRVRQWLDRARKQQGLSPKEEVKIKAACRALEERNCP